MLFDHQSPENVKLFDPQWARPLLRLVLCELHEQPRSLQKVIGLSVKLDCLQDLLLIQKMLSVFGKQG